MEKQSALADYAKYFQNLSSEQKARYPVIWADYVAAMRKWSAEVWEPDQAALRTWEAAAKTAREAGQPEPVKPDPSGARPAPPGNEGTPTTLFNAMINPLIPYAIKGVIWYQGESNAGDDVRYGVLFPAMIADWRDRWGEGDFPFFFVQLAGYRVNPIDPVGGRWALLRESQSKALELNNTGMATAVDIGEETDVHPRNKFDVAKRLALLASNRVYGQKTVDGGPLYDSMKIEGGNIRVTFRNVGAGLVIAGPPVIPGATPNPVSAELSGFEIAGTDQKWQPAKAVIAGNAVTLSSEAIATPGAVRYAWADFPACSLYNRDGLPAFPFRTDNWK